MLYGSLIKKIWKRTVNGKVEFLVSFEGWPSKYNILVSASDINDQQSRQHEHLRYSK